MCGMGDGVIQKLISRNLEVELVSSLLPLPLQVSTYIFRKGSVNDIYSVLSWLSESVLFQGNWKFTTFK